MRAFGIVPFFLLLFLNGCDVSRDSNPAASEESPVVVEENDGSTFSGFQFTVDGEEWNLGEGKYLVAFLSDSCAHCEASVALMNDFVAQYGTDMKLRPIALCLGEETTLEEFRSKTMPSFPMVLIPLTEFFARIGNAPPRFCVVNNGKEIKHWDGEFPAVEELIAELNS